MFLPSNTPLSSWRPESKRAQEELLGVKEAQARLAILGRDLTARNRAGYAKDIE
jgi:hypothetical protein